MHISILLRVLCGCGCAMGYVWDCEIFEIFTSHVSYSYSSLLSSFTFPSSLSTRSFPNSSSPPFPSPLNCDRYEDSCRQLLGNKSYTLFGLDKVIQQTLKCLQVRTRTYTPSLHIPFFVFLSSSPTFIFHFYVVIHSTPPSSTPLTSTVSSYPNTIYPHPFHPLLPLSLSSLLSLHVSPAFHSFLPS